MNQRKPLLEIRLTGQAVERGRVPVAHLAGFLSNWRKTLQRTGRVLRGETESVRRGQPPQDLKSELEFELASLSQEGAVVVLGLERGLDNTSFPELDFGLEVLQSAIGGLKDVEDAGDGEPLPKGLDAGVLRAWRDAGVLFGQGIDRIEFTLNTRDGPIRAALTPSVLERIRQRLTRPQFNIRTIQGRLLMIDFTDRETRCRMHPADGEPILCVVDDERKEAVLANMLQDVLITGEVQEDPATGKITAIAIHDIERLNNPSGPPPQEPPAPPALLEETEETG